MKTIVAAGQIWRSQLGRLVRIEQVRRLAGHGAYALAREVTPSGRRASGDRDGVPRHLPMRIRLTWKKGVAEMPPGFALEGGTHGHQHA
jgi:hypothetical protein